MARGVILNPDPPTSKGAIVGNKNNYISLGTLSFLKGTERGVSEAIDRIPIDEVKKIYTEAIQNQGCEKNVFIYINNLGYKLCIGTVVDFDLQDIDVDYVDCEKRIAINVVPVGVCP